MKEKNYKIERKYPMSGKHHSEESKRKISEAKKGRPGHRLGIKLSYELRKKMSEAHKGEKNSNYGKPRSNETRKKISLANQGKHHSEETKRKISLANKGKIISEWQKELLRQANKNKIRSEEFRKKVSLVHKGKKLSEETKRKIREKRFLQKTCFVTSIELKVRHFLDILNIDHINHKYINDISLPCQCDIYIPQYNLIIECDGNYWHNYPNGTIKDSIRTTDMINKGFKVLRLWESEIKTIDINLFKERLEKAIN